MKRLIAYFVKNPLVVYAFTALVFVVGLLIFLNMRREDNPKVDFAMMSISTTYPGAAPKDVELNVTKHIEDELDKVKGIKKYSSVSSESLSLIMVEIDIDEKDPEKAKDDVRKAVDLAKVEFPTKAETPEVEELDTTSHPVLYYIVYSNELSEIKLRKIADDLETTLKDINGVSKVDKTAYRDREIHIKTDLRKLKELKVSLQDVANAIKQYKVRSGGGSIDSVVTEKSIVTITDFQNLDSILNVIVRSNFEGKSIKIKDVATVERGFEERKRYVRANKKNGILLGVFKKENADAIRTVENIKKQIKEFQKNLKNQYQEKVKITVVWDDTSYMRQLLGVLASNALIGFVLVFLVLLFFLDFKAAFWTAFSIPFVMLITFIVMKLIDYTINTVTLFAMISVIGILVDDGIIITENIYRKRELGFKGSKAALEGIWEVFFPVLATVLTTILAFMPLGFMGGIMGKFVVYFPVVVIIALLSSLIEAGFFLPAHFSHQSKKALKHKNIEKKKWFQAIIKVYKSLLKRLLKFRYLVLLCFILLLMSLAFIVPKMKFEMFSDKENQVIMISLEGPEGLTIDETLRRAKKVEEVIFKTVPSKELQSVITDIGLIEGDFSSDTGKNKATIKVFLVPYTKRKRIAADVTKDLRLALKDFKGFKELKISEEGTGVELGDPVSLIVISNNEKLRKKFEQEIKSFLKTQKGVFSINSDSEKKTEEIHLQFDFDTMYRLGITPQLVASTIRLAYYGEEVTSIIRDNEEVNLVVKLKDEYKKDVKLLNELLIPNNEGKLVPLKNIASFPVKKSVVKISRYNGKRSVTVGAQIDKKVTSINTVMKALLKKFQPMAAKYTGLKLKVGSQAEENQNSMIGIAKAGVVAIAGIFVILLLIFRSFSQPLLVLTVIPFGAVGVIYSFLLHNENLSFFGLIGFIALSGVVVNDSIVMVDFINKLKIDFSNKAKLLEEVLEGASQRLRPIILTTLTTAIGLFPTIYGLGGSVYLLRPFAMAMAYGLIFGTLITLILIPSIYLIDADIKRLFFKINQFFKKKKKEV